MTIDFKKIHDEFKLIIAEINKANRIIIFRHEMPDYDALGSQMGLYTFIKENYPSKEVFYVGDSHRSFIPSLFPEIKEDPSIFDKPYLAIVVDTGNVKRVASNNEFRNATSIIKIDHHPNVEPFGNINCVYPSLSSCAELISLLIFSMKKRKQIISKEAATYLYIGIVGDTGRFLYPDTSSMTFRIAGDLCDIGIDKDDIYNKMYAQSMEELEFLKWVLNNYKITKEGTCYYVIDDATCKRLGILPSEGKLHINTFRNVEGVKCVASITEDVSRNEWRVSLRGTLKGVEEVAKKYRGGGHKFASGAKLLDISELDSLIKDLDEAK